MVSVPMMTVVAVAGFNASSGPGLGLIPSAEAAQGEAEGEAKGEAEGAAKGEGEAEGRAEGEAEGRAEGEGEAEGKAEGEAEGVSAKLKKAVRRPEGYTPYQGNVADLRAKGEKLFNDTSLSSNGLACATCHANGAGYNATFKNEYPHAVAMGKRDFGMDMVYLDEMVQICMVAPMAAEPLEWGSEELAALTEYSRVQQKEFIDKQ
ncbi:hypothetical protein [Marinobacter santoriniensis]|nr:hypothetical protein [Marinobacter santoriniensis]